MTFNEILSRALEGVDGAVAAGLIGTDGIGVEMVQAESSEGSNLLATHPSREEKHHKNGKSYEGLGENGLAEIELSSLMNNLNRTVKKLNAGNIRDFILETDTHTFVVSMVNPEYFLVIALGAHGNLGKARFQVRKAVAELKAEV